MMCPRIAATATSRALALGGMQALTLDIGGEDEEELLGQLMDRPELPEAWRDVMVEDRNTRGSPSAPPPPSPVCTACAMMASNIS